MWNWFSLWNKVYSFTEILSLIGEDEMLYIDEKYLVIKRGEQIIRQFEIYNPYGQKSAYLYREISNLDE